MRRIVGLIGFAPSTIEIIKILVEISEKIAVKIRNYFQQSPIEKDKTEFYERTKKYYERIRKLYYENEGNPERLAIDIAKDNLFSFIVGHEYAESICNALHYVDKISKRRKREKRQILKMLLKIFENIGANAFGHDLL